MRRAILALGALGLIAASPSDETAVLAAEEPARETVLILFPGCHEGASSSDWKPLQDALPPGFTVIAPELPRIEADGDNTVWMAAWRKEGAATVDRAFAEARKRNPKAFLVAGGAGCGGFFALLTAERHDVDAVVTISGLSDGAQRKSLRSRRTPVLGIAAADDGGVPERVEEIVRWGGPGSLFYSYPGKAHGTALLPGAPERSRAIIRWVQARATARR